MIDKRAKIVLTLILVNVKSSFVFSQRKIAVYLTLSRPIYPFRSILYPFSSFFPGLSQIPNMTGPVVID